MKTWVAHAEEPEKNGSQDLLLSSVTCWNTVREDMDNLKHERHFEMIEDKLKKAKELAEFYGDRYNYLITQEKQLVTLDQNISK